MLEKLLKYDFRYVYKLLGIYYIITIVSVACGVLLHQIHEPPFIIGFLAEFLTNAGMGLSVGLIISAFTRTWVRFRQSLYGDESYLTHTLPISRLQLFASKFLSAVVILLISVALIIAVVAVIFFRQLSEFNIFTTTILDTGITYSHAGIVLLILLVVQSIFIIMSGFTGIVLGHRFNSSRGLASWLIGVGCYLVVSLILLGLIFLLGHSNPEFNALIAYGHQPSLPTLLELSWICTAGYIVATIVMFVVNTKSLQHGVDVE